jgi:GntR family transcriptional regulator
MGTTNAKYIADRIRLLIATKQFQVNELLPSTRSLGKQLNVSFHTIHKAYRMLEEEGILRGEQGRGFIVARQTSKLDKTERLEIGSDRIRTVLEELIGYGLSEEEVEEVFEEQLGFLEWPERLQSCASIGATREHAEMLSEAIKSQVGVKSSTLTINQIEKAVNFDALFVPIPYYQEIKEQISSDILMLPILYTFNTELLIDIVERAGMETLGLVTAQEETIPILVDELKLSLKFSGSIIAGSVYGKSLPLFVRDVDLILYTPASAILVEKLLPDKRRLKLYYHIAEHSSNIIRAELWDQ